MNLEAEFLVALGKLNEAAWDTNQLKSQAISLIDLTLLDETASPLALQSLSQSANEHHVAAICVLPQHIKTISSAISAKHPAQIATLKPEDSVRIATVVNFSTGEQTIDEVLSAIDLIHSQVDEIDYVFPYQSYLNGEQHYSLAHCLQAYTRCREYGITFKVILETGCFPTLASIYTLSNELISNGCDFLKTSTGKTNQGATPAAAFAILKAIQHSHSNCGLKVSGGIKQPAQAFTYMCLAQQTLNRNLDKSWFRIGASSLLNELLM
ncbi:deoxyribose-phosphate aldolase [Legionella cardiaca]|uniref:deoxyribose-phosphate aldolase n=1 Tax=Legionella cardiaca TaxID=1071983 RepID=A0ABY8AWM9_9GAMM|nr:deoxyribose-phosphate aldolase [Legionella cardiaca]WED44131.1 deoxyribose-phosphate aldolase [Legionella cardiaca]